VSFSTVRYFEKLLGLDFQKPKTLSQRHSVIFKKISILKFIFSLRLSWWSLLYS